MKSDIHPTYDTANVTCSCGNTFTTRSTKSELSVELCSSCHPFYTGKQKFVDTGGRMQRFQQKLEAASTAPVAPKKARGKVVAAGTPLKPALDPKVLKARADRAAAEAVKQAATRKAAEEAAKIEAEEKKAAAAAAKAEAAAAAAKAPEAAEASEATETAEATADAVTAEPPVETAAADAVETPDEAPTEG